MLEARKGFTPIFSFASNFSSSGLLARFSGQVMLCFMATISKDKCMAVWKRKTGIKGLVRWNGDYGSQMWILERNHGSQNNSLHWKFTLKVMNWACHLLPNICNSIHRFHNPNLATHSNVSSKFWADEKKQAVRSTFRSFVDSESQAQTD